MMYTGELDNRIVIGMEFYPAEVGIVSPDGIETEDSLAIEFTTQDGTKTTFVFIISALECLESWRSFVSE